MALKIPSSLKVSHLKILAFKCGISTSGTKTSLTQRLIDEIPLATTNNHGSRKTRILSIDMGIRNLAYCILDVPSKSSKSPQLPSIHSWQRLSISTTPPKSAFLPAHKESFSPARLSAAAYDLLRNRLLIYNPSHILIERQRFRSMGSPHVLEWTVRVNMFESMLYAVLYTLKEERLWDGDVVAVAPGKVGPFWIEEDAGDKIAVVDGDPTANGRGRKSRKSQSAKIKNKGMKIDLVRNWLEQGEMVKLGSLEAEGVAKAYREKWNRIPGQKRDKKLVVEEVTETVDEMGKLDDLADSLLQGMAWVQWEKNKSTAMKHGMEALLD